MATTQIQEWKQEKVKNKEKKKNKGVGSENPLNQTQSVGQTVHLKVGESTFVNSI